MDIGSKIRDLRIRKNLTQEELGNELIYQRVIFRKLNMIKVRRRWKPFLIF